MNDVLIICTRNRIDQIKLLINELRKQTYLPSKIVICDSSDSLDTQRFVALTPNILSSELLYIKSSQGLPLQRNFAVEFVKLRFTWIEIVHFLDDDVLPNPNYFKEANASLVKYPHACAVGGWDLHLNSKIHKTPIRRIAILGSSKTGVILKSGIAIPPRPDRFDIESEWLVGATQSLRMSVFDFAKYDEGRRMYGEDLDFYIRIRDLSPFICSKGMFIQHAYAASNRNTVRSVEKYSDGMRWEFSILYPDVVSKSCVLLASFCLFIGELSIGLLKMRTVHFHRALGHLDFFWCLALRKSVRERWPLAE
jgi:GT2 family glycosyltransferase